MLHCNWDDNERSGCEGATAGVTLSTRAGTCTTFASLGKIAGSTTVGEVGKEAEGGVGSGVGFESKALKKALSSSSNLLLPLVLVLKVIVAPKGLAEG